MRPLPPPPAAETQREDERLEVKERGSQFREREHYKFLAVFWRLISTFVPWNCIFSMDVGAFVFCFSSVNCLSTLQVCSLLLYYLSLINKFFSVVKKKNVERDQFLQVILFFCSIFRQTIILFTCTMRSNYIKVETDHIKSLSIHTQQAINNYKVADP